MFGTVARVTDEWSVALWDSYVCTVEITEIRPRTNSLYFQSLFVLDYFGRSLVINYEYAA
jgi:hypothetical protein